MLFFVKEFLDNRKKKKIQILYNNGFDYAAGVLLRGEATPAELKSCFYGYEIDDFDNGIIGAINKLLELGIIEDED